MVRLVAFFAIGCASEFKLIIEGKCESEMLDCETVQSILDLSSVWHSARRYATTSRDHAVNVDKLLFSCTRFGPSQPTRLSRLA